MNSTNHDFMAVAMENAIYEKFSCKEIIVLIPTAGCSGCIREVIEHFNGMFCDELLAFKL